MADNEVNHQDLAVELMVLVLKDDAIGAKRLLAGIRKQDKKIIYAQCQKDCAPLLYPANSGNKDLVEFLVKYCQANVEKSDNNRYSFDPSHLVTPLWYAAENDRLEVVKLLQELGADINAASYTAISPVNSACSRRKIKTVEFLVKRGADINRPDEHGRTCLMNSVLCLELCQFLIENGALVNEQDKLGNTALHHAIETGDLETVQFLLDHGSDQNKKNKRGDDALQFASLRGNHRIAKKLEAWQNPSRWIESLQLLGSFCFFSEYRVRQALDFWEKFVTFRIMNPWTEISKIESMPVGVDVEEISTAEDLKELCQDEEMVHMYALEILFRILGPGHSETINGLDIVSNVFARNGKYRRSFNLLKYAFQLLQCTPTWTEEYFHVLEMLHRTCSAAFCESKSQIEFRDILEIFDMMTSNAQVVKELNFSSMQLLLQFVLLVVKLDKSSDQMFSFKQIIYRMVHSQIKDENDQTFLHYAVAQFHHYPGIVEILLECGANVNALDARNNTALHLVGITATYVTKSVSHIAPFDDGDERSKLAKLLLQYSAHPDIVNDDGHFAVKGLSLNMLDHVNLKCLAAAVIRNHQIPYVGQIPESLESFVKMHGIFPSSNAQYRSRLPR